MKVYIAEKIKQVGHAPAGNQTSVWCMGHMLQMKLRRSSEQINAIQNKWDARKQHRVLMQKVQESKILENKKTVRIL